MSELFDKEVNAQKASLKKTSGVHASSRMPTKKCAMKMKETRKKRRARKNVFQWWKEALYIRRTQRTGENDLNMLRVNDSGHNEGTSYLFSKRVNWYQGDGFSSVGARTSRGAIKLAMAGTQDWCMAPIFPIVGLSHYILILYR